MQPRNTGFLFNKWKKANFVERIFRFLDNGPNIITVLHIRRSVLIILLRLRKRQRLLTTTAWLPFHSATEKLEEALKIANPSALLDLEVEGKQAMTMLRRVLNLVRYKYDATIFDFGELHEVGVEKYLAESAGLLLCDPYYNERGQSELPSTSCNSLWRKEHGRLLEPSKEMIAPGGNCPSFC